VYRADFLTEPEERELLDELDELEFHEIRMRGQTARRTVRHFGYDYDYEAWRVTPGEPPPDWLIDVQSKCARLASVEPAELAEILLTRYPRGASIGWHRDAPMFGKVVGVSLGSACRMRFQRGKGAERRVYELELAPRSAYVLDGPVRNAWQHSIPPTKDLRYSITFRTLRESARSPRTRDSPSHGFVTGTVPRPSSLQGLSLG
jgi:alkylated DNA repair protein (DNA oxidative demethylase)